MKHRIERLIVPLFVLLFLSKGASQSVAALQKQAENNLSQNKLADAAAIFERAARLKNGDHALFYQAADAYYRVRDYGNAASCYKIMKDNPDFPLAALRYARSLKQQGKFQEALGSFIQAGEKYSGNHEEIILAVVQNEIKGCQLALQQTTEPASANDTLVLRLPEPVNSPENEFAPLPFSDTLLYFSIAHEKQSILMRSSRNDGKWKKPIEAFGLPASAAKGFLSGAFSPDGQRFYFTRTETPPMASQGGSIPTDNTAIFALKRNENGSWSEPLRLRAYINLEGSKNLWPFVCHFDKEEWLFFASDRPGGIGGLDLYVCKRPLDADDFDFSFPLNLGTQVNTGGDEVTPFYEAFSKTLWFSSIGHPSFGGFDVQHCTGESNHWTHPQNAGAPINSPADDFYFTLKRDISGAFLVSNRAIGKEKESTMNDDLFEVLFPEN